jgi:hypothetical protein
MSRMRISAKLRQNHCYNECAKLLDDLGLRWEINPPTGKGHPFFSITRPDGGEPIIQSVSCTPRSRGTGRTTLAMLRRKLKQAGILAQE